VASTARAICKMTECKKQKVKIGKNELRFGVWVDYGEHQGWAWRHWGCVTPKQLESLHDVLEGDVEMFDGYEELPNDCQEKVKRALQNGHVDDEDWKGDVEQNRPGMKGFRSPAARKKKAAEQEVLSSHSSLYPIAVIFTSNYVHRLYPGCGCYLQSDAEEGDQSPSKPAPKKRGRPKKDVSEDDNVEEPAPKKAKVTTKRGKKVKDEGEADDVAENEANDNASKSSAKKGKQTKGKDVEPDVAPKPKAKAAAKKTKAVKQEPATDGTNLTPTVPPKKKAAGKEGRKAVKDEDELEDPNDAQAQPVKAAKRSRKTKMEHAEEGTPASEHDEPVVKSAKKPRATKNAANTKKPIAKKGQKDVDVDAEAPVAEAPKAKRGRKKADS
ncbi:MAG: hypothetical protein LQ349_009176, partial [Xanthoria aureola]